MESKTQTGTDHRLLTVAIPTYNRAELLDRQVAWLATALRGYEDVCEVLISDNHSTDATPEVIDRWRPKFERTSFRVSRHARNIGAVRNIASCIENATARHVWVISDDDPIAPGTVGYVVQSLDECPNLGLLNLNYSMRRVATGELLRARCYSFREDEVHRPGRRAFEQCLSEDIFGVATTTAQVYETDLARRAISEWPDGLDNLAVQIYWSGYCALRGSMKVTADAHLECAIGAHYFSGNPLLKFRLRFTDMAEVAERLEILGYSRRACNDIVVRQVGSLPANARTIAGAAADQPFDTARALKSWLGSLSRAGWREVAGYVLKAMRRRLAHAARRAKTRG
ncbi:hypothetical protein BH18ACT15_BH18ACT15_04180 [soil metagenome]